jgi:hypothetical protein
MVEPRERHWVAGKHILRYLRGTIAYGLKYTSSGGVMLYDYADSNLARSPVDRKSTLLKIAASEGILQREVLSDHPEASQGDLEIKQSCESWQESRPTYKPCEPGQKSGRKRCCQR